MEVLHRSGSWVMVYISTQCRLAGLALGCLMALWINHGVTKGALGTASQVAFFAGLIGMIFQLRPGFCTDQHHLLLYSFIALGFAGVLGVSLVHNPKWLSNRTLGYVAKISYAVYLIHIKVFWIAADFLANKYHWPNGIVAGTQIAVTLVVASLSWYLLESRILKLRHYFESPGVVPVLAATRTEFPATWSTPCSIRARH
jgi:peptidoglycan/LPS O-acetylase OafA/YrhL